MTNYEQWQMEKYGNIVGANGEKNDRQLSASEQAENLLEQIKNNNTRIIDLINEMPDWIDKAKYLERLVAINENTQQSLLKLTE